jgi:hypothetical protein
LNTELFLKTDADADYVESFPEIFSDMKDFQILEDEDSGYITYGKGNVLLFLYTSDTQEFEFKTFE